MIERTMKNGFKLILTSGIAVVVAQLANAADNQPAQAQTVQVAPGNNRRPGRANRREGRRCPPCGLRRRHHLRISRS